MVADFDPSYTRVDMIRDGREKWVFEECRRIKEAGTAKSTNLQIGMHASFIVDLARAIASTTHERMYLREISWFQKRLIEQQVVVQITIEISRFLVN